MNKFFPNRAHKEFVSLFKKEMIMSALDGNDLFEDMKFDYNIGFDVQTMNDSGMFELNRFHSDCLLQGKYRGVNFVQADVHNQVESSAYVYITNLDGTYFMYPVNLPDAPDTVIFEKNPDFGVILPGRSYKTKNADFDKKFEVYTENKKQAAGLLTQDVIKQVLNIKSKIDGMIAFKVINGKMYLYVSKKNSKLRPKLSSTLDGSTKQAVIDELSRIKLFIDAFSI